MRFPDKQPEAMLDKQPEAMLTFCILNRSTVQKLGTFIQEKNQEQSTPADWRKKNSLTCFKIPSASQVV